MSVLFTQSWDIIQGKDVEYTQFIVDTYLPEMAEMGLIPVGGYYVEVGFGPRIVAVFSVNETEEVLKTIAGKKFKDLLRLLKTIVMNYGNHSGAPRAWSNAASIPSRRVSGSSTSATTETGVKRLTPILSSTSISPRCRGSPTRRSRVAGTS